MDIELQLTAFGCEIAGIAGNAEDAVRLSAAAAPDLILMDVQLRAGLDGCAAARQRNQSVRLFDQALPAGRVALRGVCRAGASWNRVDPILPGSATASS